MLWDRQNLFVIAEFVSTYLTVILPGFQMFCRYNGVFVIAGFVVAGFHCISIGLLRSGNQVGTAATYLIPLGSE